MIFQHLIPKGVKALREADEAIINAVKPLDKPMAIVLMGIPELREIVMEEQERFSRAGLSVYSSLASAAQAISKLIQYQDYRSSLTAMGQTDLKVCPYKLINILRRLAARKTFKGTCPVCKDWSKQ